MDILHTLGYTIASYIAVYTVLMIIGAIVFGIVAWKFLKGWRREERVYRRNAAYIRSQHKRMEEWDKHFRSQREKHSGI